MKRLSMTDRVRAGCVERRMPGSAGGVGKPASGKASGSYPTNDVWHGENDPKRGTSKDRFESGLKEIIGKIKDAKARVILCTPSVIGEKADGSNKLDARLDEYADISRRVAREEKVELCDLRRAFLDYLKKHNDDNKERGILTTDRVHLNEAGNRFVAEVMLKSLGE